MAVVSDWIVDGSWKHNMLTYPAIIQALHLGSTDECRLWCCGILHAPGLPPL